MIPNLAIGRYRHYKGQLYQVFGLARHTETEEFTVLYGKGLIEWARPYTNFTDWVETPNGWVPRFQIIPDE